MHGSAVLLLEAAVENQYHEGATEPQSQGSDFSHIPDGSVSRPRQAPLYRVVFIPIGLIVSAVILVVTQISPTGRAESNFSAGNSAYDVQNYDRAIDKYDEAIRLKPDYADAYNNRGLAYQARGNTDQAIADFGEAIRLNPGLGQAYSNRGLAYQAQGNYDQAIADFDEAVKFMYGAASVYNNRGLAYRDIGEYDKAIADFSQAIEQDVFHATAEYYDNRATTYWLIDDYDASIADFDAAIQAAARFDRGLSPDTEAVEPNTVDHYVDERLAELQFNEELPLFYAHRGLAHLSQGNLDQSLSDLDRAIKLKPKLALAYLLRGMANRAAGDYDRAIDDFQTVLALDNDPDMQSEAELQLREIGVQPGLVAP